MPEWSGEESEGGRGEERQGRERKVGRTRGRVGDHSGGWRAREGEEGWRVGVSPLAPGLWPLVSGLWIVVASFSFLEGSRKGGL